METNKVAYGAESIMLENGVELTYTGFMIASNSCSLSLSATVATSFS